MCPPAQLLPVAPGAQGARRLARQAREAFPASPACWLVQAQVLARDLRGAGQAEALVRRVLQEEPRCEEAALTLAVLLAQQGRQGEADALLADQLAAAPSLAVHVLAGRMALESGRLEDAASHFNAALGHNPFSHAAAQVWRCGRRGACAPVCCQLSRVHCPFTTTELAVGFDATEPAVQAPFSLLLGLALVPVRHRPPMPEPRLPLSRPPAQGLQELEALLGTTKADSDADGAGEYEHAPNRGTHGDDPFDSYDTLA